MTTRPLNPDAALPIGIEIGGHAIEAVVAVGETGFVYAASDPLLARQVAIKEYFPPALAVRHSGTQMRARSASDHRLVMEGRDAFVEESRLLARLDHPALVRVIGAHDAHQTAYRVMPFHAGSTLAQARLERGVPPGDDWLLRMIGDLLGALETLHEAGIVHGHVDPSQVMLKADDRPLLLGFGSAARVLQRGIDPAYVPPELAPGGEEMQRGPWTDLHALAALAWFTVMGTTPSNARGVAMRAAFDAAFGAPEDDVQAVQRDRLCAALARALAPKPADRPQTVAEMRALLGASPQEEAAPAKPPELPPEPDPRVRAAIAAAVASIPDLAPITLDGRADASRSSATTDIPPRQAPAVSGLAPQHVPGMGPKPVEVRPPAVEPAKAASAATAAAAAAAAATAATAARAVPATAPPAFARTPAAAPAEPPRAPAAPEPVATTVARAGTPQPAFERAARRGSADPVFDMPKFDLPRSGDGRQEPSFERAPHAERPPAPKVGATPDPAVRPAPSRPTVEPRADAATAASAWGRTASTPAAAEAAASTRTERAERTFIADRSERTDAEPAARPRPRRTGWAWAVAVLVGVATGVIGWQWTELRQRDTERVAVLPSPSATERSTEGTAPAPATPPTTGSVAQAPATLPMDPSKADPTAAGQPNAQATPAPAPALPPVAGAGTVPTPTPPATPPAATGAGDERVAAVAPATAPPVAEETVPTRPPAGAARESTAVRTPQAAPRQQPAPPRRAAVAAAPSLPSPRAMCGDRANFSLVYCMQQQCRRPAYSAHPQCREFRRTGEVN